MLRESARHDRVETAARARLGLPLDLADDAFADVDERLSPRPSLRAALAALPPHERRALELRVVDARTYNPIEFRTRGTGGGTVLRFVTYERLPLTDDSRALLSIAAQHGDAPVVRDAAAYRAAVARLFPHG